MVKRRFVVDLLISPKEKMIHGRQINSMEGEKIFAGRHKNLNIVPPFWDRESLTRPLLPYLESYMPPSSWWFDPKHIMG